jgi:two-component system cell cycle response regulator
MIPPFSHGFRKGILNHFSPKIEDNAKGAGEQFMTGRLLIVDDVPTNRIVLKAKLAAAGYDPVVAPDAATALVQLRSSMPDLVVVDLSACDGLALIGALRARAATAQLPIVVMTPGGPPGLRAEYLRAGADEVLAKPVDDQHLLALIRSHMRHIALAVADPTGQSLRGLAEGPSLFQPQGQIVLITARPETALRLKRDLSAHCRDRITTLPPEEALANLTRPGHAPDAVVIEVDLPEAGGGLRLMSELQSRATTCHAKFVLLVSSGTQISAPMAYDLGAHAIVDLDTTAVETALRLSRLIGQKQAADRRRASVQDSLRLAAHDPLTGLYNRRYIDQQLVTVVQDGARDGVGFAVLVVDLDRFKQVNDNWGHPAGDAVLVAVAERMGQSLRRGDLLARMGGEEFLAILPGASLADARTIGERLCHSIEAMPIEVPQGYSIPVTVSVGIATCRPCSLRDPADLASEVVEHADRALLYAKSHGRNRVTVFRSAA